MTSPPNDPLALSKLLPASWRDFLRSHRPLIQFELQFKLLEAILIVPAVTWLLTAVVARSGRFAVGNRDILDFLLTPLGLIYASLLAASTVGLRLIEQAALMQIVDSDDPTHRPPALESLPALIRHLLTILKLGVLKSALILLALTPFGLLAWLTWVTLLSEHDIYFYLRNRPPVFHVAVAIGVLLAACAIATFSWLYVRWSLSTTCLLSQGGTAHAQLRASRTLVHGDSCRIAFILLLWHALGLGGTLSLQALLRMTAHFLLEDPAESPLWSIPVLLAIQALLVAISAFVWAVGLAILTRRIHLARSGQAALCPTTPTSSPPIPRNVFLRRLTALSLPLLLTASLFLGIPFLRELHQTQPIRVAVTAHRGHARAAPENTLSALRRAIESGADYAEIDVHATADGVIVLLHDRDLKRVAGDPRRLSDLTLDQLRSLDVGSWFAPEFAGERVPTLAEAIDLCRGKIKLHIELKFFDPNNNLARQVARLIHDERFESESLVASFRYEALIEARRENPQLRAALTLAQSLGDPSRLDLNALSVRADFLSDDLLRSAQSRGLEVHVWTINNRDQMTRLIKRGVDNILTSDPDLLIEVRNELAALSPTDRLLLNARLLLGLNP